MPGPGIVAGLKEAMAANAEAGILLLAEMSSKGNLINSEYTKATVAMEEANQDFVFGFIAQNRLRALGAVPDPAMYVWLTHQNLHLHPNPHQLHALETMLDASYDALLSRSLRMMFAACWGNMYATCTRAVRSFCIKLPPLIVSQPRDASDAVT